jgi:hypothetical protein
LGRGENASELGAVIMKGLFFKYWDRVRSSFWFVPATMATVAVALAFVGVTVDEPVTDWLTLNLGWTFIWGAQGTSAVLGIIAASMITIAGLIDFRAGADGRSVRGVGLDPRSTSHCCRHDHDKNALCRGCGGRRKQSPI